MTTTPLRLVVAVGRADEAGTRVATALRRAGHTVTLSREASFDELLEATRALLASDPAPDGLVVVGGDGMVHLGVNLVAGTPIALGLVPSGTGNDMARALGLPHDDAEAATRLLVSALDREPRVIDAGRVETSEGGAVWFAGTASVGFDAVVNERANRLRWPKGPQRYTVALLIELIRLKHLSYRLVLDGVEQRVAGTLVSIGNGTSIGGGMLIAPDARLDDGLFDVVVVERLTRLQFLRIFPRVYKGTHLGDHRVHVHRAARVHVEADGVVGYADGERVGALPADLEIVPGALRVFAAADSAAALSGPGDTVGS